MTNARLISAERERQTVPAEVLEIFEDMTNSELASIANDRVLNMRRRMHARLELEYREASGVLVDFGPDGFPRRLVVDADTMAMLRREKANPPKAINRQRYSVEAINARIRAAMARRSGAS